MDKKAALEALQGSETGYRLLFEHSPWAIALLFGAPPYEFFVNPAFLALFEYTVEEMQAFSIDDIGQRVHSDDRKRVQNRLCRIFEKNNSQETLEFRIKTGTSQIRWVSAGISLYQDNGLVFCLVALHNITGYKLAELQQRIEKTESLGRMAGAIAHHYNNLIGIVLGNLEMAMEDLSGNAGLAENLSEALSAARRVSEMGGLMTAYLGQTTVKRETLDLSDVCQERLPLFLTAMHGHIPLEASLPMPGPTVNANADQIRQIMDNLVINAQEAMDGRRGSVRIAVQTVSSTDISKAWRFPAGFKPGADTYASLEVTDQGYGIPEADIEKIFDPFYSTRFMGRGLGLAVVLGIVTAHEGCITVDSEPEGKTVFRVHLPVSGKPVPGFVNREGKAPNPPKNGVVLLVEDEEALRRMAANMLAMLDMRVIAAKDGVEAMEKFSRHKNEIGCVLCDLTMPRMNGWETLEALRQIAPEIPVILSSGYDQSHVMEGIHPEEPQAFLGKPYGIAALRETLAKVMPGKTPIPAHGNADRVYRQ